MLVKFELNALTVGELEKEAKTKYDEDGDRLKKDLIDIKDWITKNPHLQNVRQDSTFLEYFLRGCGHSVEKTKKRLDKFFSVQANLPAWFDNWDPETRTLQEIMNAGIFLPLSGYDKLGRRSF